MRLSEMRLGKIFEPFKDDVDLEFLAKMHKNLLFYSSQNVSESKDNNPHDHWLKSAKSMALKSSWTVSNIYKNLVYVKHIRKRSKVLDIGCGIGALLHFAQDDFKRIHYHGIDCLESALLEAMDVKTPHNAIFVQHDVTTGLPFYRDESFDSVVLAGVIEHIEPMTVAPLIEEIRRVLVPSGRLMLLTPVIAEGEAAVWKDSDDVHIKEWQRQQIEDLIEDVGFEIDYVLGGYQDYNRLLKAMSPEIKPFYLALRKVVPGSLLLPMFGLLYPDACKEMNFICHKI